MLARPRRSSLTPLSLSMLLIVAIGTALAAPATARRPQETDQRDADGPPPLILDDPPQPLEPKRPRTEVEEDRLEALALFAAGRTFEHRAEDADSPSKQQAEYARALRYYQRAFRRDPQAVTVGRAILPLAAEELDRPGVAARYALKLERDQFADVDPMMVRALAVRLTMEEDWAGAAGLYERAIAALADRIGNRKTAADVLLRVEAGRLYLLAEQYEKASDCYGEVIDALKDPDKFELDESLQKIVAGESGSTYHLAGESCLQAGRLDAARAAFNKAHEIKPQDGRLHFNLARVSAREHKPEQALESLQACYRKNVADEGMAPYELLAEVLKELGKEDELIGRLESLRGDDPENVPLGYSLGQAYLEAGEFAKAQSLYVELTEKKKPTLTGYRRLAEIYRKTNRPEALLKILGRAVEKLDGLEGLDEEVAAIAGDAKVLQALAKAARRRHQAEPDKLSYEMRFAVALLATEARQWETAAEFFDLALEAQPDRAAELLLLWGVGLLLEERTAEAAKVLQRAIDEKAAPKDNPAFHYYLAAALAVEDRTEEALAAARKAAELRKDSPLFELRIAWVLSRAKRNDEAIQQYRRIIDKYDPDHQSSDVRDMVREARLMLSNLYVLEDRQAEAEEELERVLDEFPGDVGASNDLGYLWADQDRHLRRALKMIQHAVDAQPDNVAYRDSLGWVFYRLGRYEEAVRELEEAAEADVAEDGETPDPVILDHLGDAYLKAKQPDKAKHAWRRAVGAFEKQEEAEKAKRVQEKIQANS